MHLGPRCLNASSDSTRRGRRMWVVKASRNQGDRAVGDEEGSGTSGPQGGKVAEIACLLFL